MIHDFELLHDDNSRRVPVRAYKQTSDPQGWIIFSVGYGGDRTGYSFMAKAWAELGFHVYVVEHVGSNLEVLRSCPPMRLAERQQEVVRRVQLPDELYARPRDLLLVYSTFKNDYRGLGLGLAGHSYGSYSVLASTGLAPLKVPRLEDPVAAQGLLIISPQPPGMLYGSDELAKVKIPTLLLTGTKDDHLTGESSYKDRVLVYQDLAPEIRHLVVLKDCEHMTFAGLGLGIEKRLSAIREVTSVWWGRILDGSSSPEPWGSELWSPSLEAEVEECR